MKDDRAFFDDRYDMFSTAGWADLIGELTNMSESINNIMAIEDEKTLNFVKGQMSVLSMLITLEETTKQVDTDDEE
jgi:hypothetical protein